jgi:chromosome segregation ATPase
VIGTTLDVNVVALIGLAAALATAYGSVRIVGPNRRKVIEEAASTATTRATTALELALSRYEDYNERLREDIDELEKRNERLRVDQDEISRRLETCGNRLRAVEHERDALQRRVNELLERPSH